MAAMKQVYIKPDIEVVEIDNETLLNAYSLGTEYGPGLGEGEVGDDTPDFAKSVESSSVWDDWE